MMNVIENKPSVVIVSSSSTKPKSLIKLITRNKNIPENDPNKISQPWQIDTKYYIAEIYLHGITEHYKRNEDFNNTVGAVIIHMDSNKHTGLQDLQKWEAIEKECDPEIKLLVTNYCTSDTKITKAAAMEWCLKRGFELVELYPTMENTTAEMEEDEIIQEKIGVDRIIEALQTHVWPNLEMKDLRSEHRNKLRDERSYENECVSVSENNASEASQSSELQINSGAGLDDFLTNEGADDFSELFAQLHMMKESIQSMPIRERKQCAEQMVTAFWNAIGGDEEEIADL